MREINKLEGTKVENKKESLFPPMDRANRAKQFMPFDALKGFQEALAEKERMIVSRKELPEDWKEALNEKLCHIQEMDLVMAEYYQNGEYSKVTGRVSKIDRNSRMLNIGHTQIPFHDLADLDLQEIHPTRQF